MAIDPPSESDIQEVLVSLGFDPSSESIAEYREAVSGSLEPYNRLLADDNKGELKPSVPIDQRTVEPPTSPTKDQLNCWRQRYEISTTDSGPLDDLRVAIKDNVAIAGIPLTCGSDALEGYTPDIDARVVDRMLSAGATIVGTTTMDSFAFSGIGDTSDDGPIYNPHDATRLAGGSSAGSAAAVADGQVPLALGGDQGGSIRVPAAWSGCVGHKPTHGLVPYTGVVRVDNTLDTVGPIARTVETAARALEVLAGPDPLDPRQTNPPTVPYTKHLDSDPSDLTIGLLEEGFAHDTLESEVENAVRNAVSEFEIMGASVKSVSVPSHADTAPTYLPIFIQGAAATIRANGLGYGWEGFYDTGLAKALDQATRQHANDLPFNAKAAAVLAEYVDEATSTSPYGLAQNRRRRLREAYDSQLASVDILALPTTPQRAMKYRPDATPLDRWEHAVAPSPNTFPFNATGHPAISIPCAKPDGLPVGLMLVGNHFDDETVLAAAHAFETRTDWTRR